MKELMDRQYQSEKEKVEKKFAFLPTKLNDGSKIWFKNYYEYSYIYTPNQGMGLAWLFEQRIVYRFRKFPEDSFFKKVVHDSFKYM